jgi:hypothetical protein
MTCETPTRDTSDLSIFKIRVFLGGSGGYNVSSIKKALRRVVKEERAILQEKGITKVEIQFMDCAAIKKSKWTMEKYIDWLASGHVYIIGSHPVQGMTSFQTPESAGGWAAWDLSSLGDTLMRKLEQRIGYPSGKHLQCGSFTQDKLVYKRVLQQSGLCSPFFELERTADGKLSSTVKRDLFR